MQYDNNEDIGFKSIKKTWKSINISFMRRKEDDHRKRYTEGLKCSNNDTG